MRCPCDSDMAYVSCCQPYHDGMAVAQTAEALMRSRFCAFYFKNTDYIIATTAPAQQNLLNKMALQTWADSVNWVRLEVVSHTPKIAKRHAQVHFRAYFYRTDEPAEQHCHDEHSSFVQIDGRWYFLDPTVEMKLTNKQPCLCGSGEKFKMCCGKFLS